MTSSLFKLGADCEKDVNLRTPIDYFKDHFVAREMALQWTSPPIRIQGKSKRLRDFVSWMSAAPVISEKARQALDSLITRHCEILPLIELHGKSHYALNVLTQVDCLDRERSDILYAENDPAHILRVKSYVLIPERVPEHVSIFKIPEDLGCVFVTQRFVDTVIANKLRGASFEDPTADPFAKFARGEPLNVVPGLPR